MLTDEKNYRNGKKKPFVKKGKIRMSNALEFKTKNLNSGDWFCLIV